MGALALHNFQAIKYLACEGPSQIARIMASRSQRSAPNSCNVPSPPCTSIAHLAVWTASSAVQYFARWVTSRNRAYRSEYGGLTRHTSFKSSTAFHANFEAAWSFRKTVVMALHQRGVSRDHLFPFSP